MGKPKSGCLAEHPEGALQQFQLCIYHRKLNSFPPAVTPATSNKIGTLALMPLPKIDELFALLKGVKFFTALHLSVMYGSAKCES